MQLKIMEAAAVPGGRALMLCDDRGIPVPQQLACTIEQNLNSVTVTVVLRVDGEHVRLVD